LAQTERVQIQTQNNGCINDYSGVAKGIAATSFDWAIKTPVAGGKSQLTGVVIRKEVSSASPRLLQALHSSEEFPTAVVETVSTGSGGKETFVSRIVLTNAMISGAKHYIATGGPVAVSPPPGTPPGMTYGQNTFSAVTQGISTLTANGQPGPNAFGLNIVPSGFLLGSAPVGGNLGPARFGMAVYNLVSNDISISYGHTR